MASAPTVQVALIGILATLITTLGVIIVAAINNRKERESSASKGMEAVLRERLAYKDERIATLENTVSRKELVIERLRSEIRELKEK